MVAVLVPAAVGLLDGVLQQLELRVSVSGGTFRQWMARGFLTYVGFHLLLYRPVPLFRVSHRVFSVLAVWLFGGQVASTEAGGGGKGGKGGKGAKASGGAAREGSTLVAFSPYVIPLYTILVCLAGWLARQWVDRPLVDGPVSFLIGVATAFHWIMTADDLQQQRSRWHVETYLVAIGLVFVVTLLIGAACLPWAIPEFSFVQALSLGLVRTQEIYSGVLRTLFF